MPGGYGPGGYAPVQVKTGPGMLVRALWFIVISWWLTGIVSAIAWACLASIILLPVGIWMVNRIPTVLTLRPRTVDLWVYTDAAGNQVHVAAAPRVQPSWVVRGIWFIFVGWWLSALVMSVGYVLVLLVITLPLGLMLYNRVPFAASLYRY
jgi:uncharacterized membrane protein YccF (DUF307 family)